MVFATAALRGALGGLAGAAVMTVAEKVEQRLTGRPNSYVPARTLARLLDLDSPDEDRWTRNMAMHYGTGRGGRHDSRGDVRRQPAGPHGVAHACPAATQHRPDARERNRHRGPPWTWPRDELVVDLLHKGIYALATGAVTDALVPPAATSSAARRSFGRRLNRRA